MSCVICRNGIHPRRARYGDSPNRGDTTVILKRVPADVCDNCSILIFRVRWPPRCLSAPKRRSGVERKWRF